MAEAAEQLHCLFGDCKAEAAVYCSVCDLLLCDTHRGVHNGLYKNATQPHKVTLAVEYAANRGENSPYCGLHDKSRIIVACEHCLQPMCSQCVDDTAITKECRRFGKAKHTTRSVEHISKQIQDELDDLLSVMRVRELTDSDDIKMKRSVYDEEMEKSRDDLDKLDTKIEELKEKLEEFARVTRESIIGSMIERKELMEEWEKLYENHQKTCTQMRERVSDFKRLNEAAIVKGQQQIKDDLQLHIRSKLEEFPQLPQRLFLEVLDIPLDIPIRLQDSPSNTNTPTTPILQIPALVQYKESRTTRDSTYCVHFTKEGQLLHSGRNLGILGLSFRPELPTHKNRYNYTICQHNNNLYILQRHKQPERYFVHKINLSDESVSENIINFPGAGYYSKHLVVNDEFIIISHYTANCVRIYSSKNFVHIFSIKHECISKWPRGVGLLGDSLVIGDYSKNQVSNMTISETPDVRWTCTGITFPSGLQVVENPQMILVGSHTTKQIYILSYQGVKLSTLAVPECSLYIHDIAVYGDQIAVADETTQIKLYEMEEL